MTQYYVSPNGNDSNSGTSRSDPFKDLKYASGLLKPGYTLHVLPGTYTTNINLKYHGQINNYINIIGEDGARITVPDNITPFEINNRSYITIDNIDIINCTNTFYLGYTNSNHINLKNIEIYDFLSTPTISNGAHDINLYNLNIHKARESASGKSNNFNIFGGGRDPLHITDDDITKDIVIDSCQIHDGGHNGINIGPGTGGGWDEWKDKKVMERITVKNCKVYDIRQIAIGANYVTAHNIDINNNDVYNSRDGIRLTLIDSKIRNNKIYEIYRGHPIALEIYNGPNKNNTLKNNRVYDCTNGSKGYYAVVIGNNKGNNTVINNHQSGQAGSIQFRKGDTNTVIDCKNGTKVQLHQGGTIYFKFSDSRTFSISGGKTGSLYYKDGYSIIKGTSSNSIIWTIKTSGSVPTPDPTFTPTPTYTPTPTPTDIPYYPISFISYPSNATIQKV